MKILLPLLAVSLAGCSLCPKQDPTIVTQTVKVPVPVKCVIKHPKKPSEKLLTLRFGDTTYAKAEASLKDLEEYRWYAKELEAALRACAADVPAH